MERTVWLNGRFLTLDPAQSRAEALVVEGERILFVGARSEAVDRGGRGAPTVDLQGRAVVPGFNDNHVHSVILGDLESAPDLSGLSAVEIVKRLAVFYRGAPPAQLLYGYGWDYPTCPDPERRLLDEAFPDHPVVLAQFGGHGLWLNSQGYRLLHIPIEAPGGSEEGLILRDTEGRATGVVREQGSNPYFARRFFRMFHVPSQVRVRLERALGVYRRLGITSVQDNAWFPRVVTGLRALRRRGALTARYCCWRYSEQPRARRTMGAMSYDSSWIRKGPVKHFLDGTFTTRTALLWNSYADDPANCGNGMGAGAILRLLRRLAAEGDQGAFHAIGDRAVSNFLDASERLAHEWPDPTGLRLRLEHAQLIRPKDIPRLRRLGILIAAQPSALTTPEKDILLLGESRARGAYPYRSLLDEGVHLSFGSDIPGEPTCDPLRCIHLAVNREGPEGISPEEALRCYTKGSAFAEFQEREKGVLAAGMLADFAVLTDDLTTVPRDRIKDIVVERTVVGGTTVYLRNNEPFGEKQRAPAGREP